MNNHQKGQLIYLVGSSGAGKDTLLNALRSDDVLTEKNLVIAHRYITRPITIDAENHIELSKSEFFRRGRLGMFALEWHAHGTYYAIGQEIEHWMNNGLNVVINGSRAFASQAQKSYPQMKIVWVSVSSVNLMKRLLKRGRESKEDIKLRIQRNAELEEKRPSHCLMLDNNHSISSTVEQFKQIL